MSVSSLSSSAVEGVVANRHAWVISRNADLAWLIGGAALSFAMLAAHLVLGVPAVVLYAAWALAIDGPHVFATVSRTYLDAEERSARSRLLVGSLAFFVVGPSTVALSALQGSRLPYDVFLGTCAIWAYWHVVRQHYGVMVLYKKKGGDLSRVDDRIDSAFLYAGLLAPVVGFLVANPRARASLGMEAPPPWASIATTVSWGVVAVALAALIARQIAIERAGRSVNWPKLMFVAAAVAVSAVLFSPPVAARIEYEAAAPIVTSFHNLQYLAIVWFWHVSRRRRGTRIERAAGSRMSARIRYPPRAGAHRARAPRLGTPVFSRSVFGFLGAGVLFTLGYRVALGCAFSAWPACDMGAMDVALPAGLTLSDLGVAFLWGFALHHYYLDQKIWHVRRDPAVARGLRLDQPS